MVRAPCCEKMGLKKGPWTPEEDQKLISYIQQHGHGNWRALPKHADLLRCGKSCRLRWTNYLRPDIKRGNFSKEEEETIIKLHDLIGNRWSAIAAKLPGRTDNEIKNVWHTHLKKRLKHNNNNNSENKDEKYNVEDQTSQPSSLHATTKCDQSESDEPTTSSSATTTHRYEHPGSYHTLKSPLRSSSSENDYSGRDSPVNNFNHDSEKQGITCNEDHDYIASLGSLPKIDDSLWMQVLPMESLTDTIMSDEEFTSASMSTDQIIELPGTNNMKEDNDFWRDLFREAGELTKLPGF
ncbi:hypothetical protein Sjap_008569 [Stephania japonica]|uniref:Uncharacterized protein n=1 Tax=Stephania japonica TaxID=461633 RepID=A0AAP0JQL4_9MAGN